VVGRVFYFFIIFFFLQKCYVVAREFNVLSMSIMQLGMCFEWFYLSGC